MLPKLYSTIEEIDGHLRSPSRPRSCGVVPRQLQNDNNDNNIHPSESECRRTRNNRSAIQQRAPASSPPLPHLFLHFDINETILVGDVAGNDTVEECLNKIIAKVAFVSTTTEAEETSITINCDEPISNNINGPGPENTDGGKVETSNGEGNNNFSNFEPKRWWDGSDLHCNYYPSSTIASTTPAAAAAAAAANRNKGNHHHYNPLDNTDTDTAAASTNPPPPSTPAPLYTGWTIPNNTCSYYKTKYKRHAKEFTRYHPQYRPMYELLQSKLSLLDCNVHEEKRGADDDNEIMFQHFLPAFFHTLTYYFPSTNATSTKIDVERNKDGNSISNGVIDYDSILPPSPRPPKTTLVLRTFGTDLHRVLRAISDFARGNHPLFPEYTNPNLIFEEDDVPFCGGWKRRHPSGNGGVGTRQAGGESGELVYELRPMQMESPSCPQHNVSYSGDDEILTYLQSKTMVGIQDDYPFWDDHDCAPWAGKPVWTRRRPGVPQNEDRLPKFNHHHILLDDNIHNDPNDGAGAVRIPVLDGVDNTDNASPLTTTTTAKYTSLHGNDALEMHGKYLVRVPTVRPIIEIDWFIRQIEDARWRLFVEEGRMNENDNDCSEESRDKWEKESCTDCITAKHSLDLSSRDLSDDELNQIFIRQPAGQALERMNLSRNRLKCLPAAIFCYSKIIHLDISRNSIHGLPTEIRNMTNLVELIALSNQIRMRQLPLEALASLRHLKVLDLRYNRKLKAGALKTLREALAPVDNSQLEIRCTTVAMDFDESSVISTARPTKLGETKKLSACDRDATLLRSQLEPLSTPQLSKRLEQTFGVLLSDEVNTQDRYNREFVMTKLLGCYEMHGPRRVVKVEGTLVPSSERLASLLAELEAIPWPRTTRERPKIRAENYMILQKPGVGKPDSARTRKETAKLDKYRSIFELAVESLAENDPVFANRFTALAVTKNFVGSPHIDTLNVGPFYALSLGEFTGGGAIAVEYSPLVVAEVNTQGRFGKVDGRFPHWVTPYEGTRYSLIYYVTSGDVEPQTTAIFPPLSDNVLP